MNDNEKEKRALDALVVATSPWPHREPYGMLYYTMLQPSRKLTSWLAVGALAFWRISFEPHSRQIE